MPMTLSNSFDAVVRFWHRYMNSLIKSGVKASAAKWYVRHAQTYVEASSGRRVGTHSAVDVEAWLGERGRVDGMADWRFMQTVEAVRPFGDGGGACGG